MGISEMLEDACKRVIMASLLDLEEEFKHMHEEHPERQFHECVTWYEEDSGWHLDRLELQHALKGYDSADL